MKNEMMRKVRTFGALIALGSVLSLTAMMSGCIGGTEAGKDGEIGEATEDINSGSAGAGGSNCLCWSSWNCAKLKSGKGAEQFDYPPAGCGITSFEAETECTVNCAVACVNAGKWTC
jgi:hypothetical protein